MQKSKSFKMRIVYIMGKWYDLDKGSVDLSDITANEHALYTDIQYDVIAHVYETVE